MEFGFFLVSSIMVSCVSINDYNDIEKDAYFLILKPSEEKIDFASLKYEAENINDPSIIFPKPKDKEDETYPGVLVFKFKRKKKKKRVRKIKN